MTKQSGRPKFESL